MHSFEAGARDSKIQQLHLSIIGQDQILRLDVTMNNVHLVCFAQCFSHGRDKSHSLLRSPELLQLHLGFQIHALNVFGDEIHLGILTAPIKNARHTGVLDARKNLDLPHKALNPLSEPDTFVKKFERALLLVHEIKYAIHGTHTTAPEQFLHPITFGKNTSNHGSLIVNPKTGSVNQRLKNSGSQRRINAMSRQPPFHLMVHYLPDGLVLLDASGLILFMNPAAERLSGSSLAEVTGKHWKDAFTIKVEDPVQDESGSLIDILLERPVLMSKSGAAIPIELQISPVSDEQDRMIGSMLILHDVSHFSEEKEGLKESRAKYKRLVNSIEGVVWEAEGESMNIRFVSDYARTLLGYPPEKWVKTPGFWKSIIFPEDRETALEIMLQAIRARENYQIEYRVTAADGTILPVKDSVTLTVTEDQFVRLTGVTTDITMSKEARDALVKSEERFSAAFYLNPLPLLLTTLAGRILDVNESYEKLTGFFREELLERTITDTGLCTNQEFESIVAFLSNRDHVHDVKLHSRTKRQEDQTILASFRTIILSAEPCILGVFERDPAR